MFFIVCVYFVYIYIFFLLLLFFFSFSFFLTENEENVSPGKKRVHFAGDGKENGRPESKLITKPNEHCLVKRHQWANMRIQALGEEEKVYPPKPKEMLGIR